MLNASQIFVMYSDPDGALMKAVKLQETARSVASELPLLTIELVPRSTWSINVRSEIPKVEWDRIRREIYRKASYRCEICGGQGPKWPVECHEIWEFDPGKRRQVLVGLTALCPDCHRVKHFGFARINGKAEEAFRHLMKVNQWSQAEANQHVETAMDEWAERSELQWSVDFSWLGGMGIHVPMKEGAPGSSVHIDTLFNEEAREREFEKFYSEKSAEPDRRSASPLRRSCVPRKCALKAIDVLFLFLGIVAMGAGIVRYLQSKP